MVLSAEQDMGAGQSGVAAELYLQAWREPAQLEIRRAGRVGHREGGLREIVLQRDRLKDLVGQPFVERHHRRRIAGEGAVGEGIDLNEWERGHSGIGSLVSSMVTSGLSNAST